MSSEAESLKKAVSEPSSDEPTSKKVKIEDTGPKDGSIHDKSKDNNNLPTEARPSKAALNGSEAQVHGKGAVKRSQGNKNAHDHNVKDSDDDEEDDEDDDVEDLDDEIDHLGGVFDPKIAKSLEQVENIQLEICALNEKASEEILRVEQKFNKLRRPYFEMRNNLLKQIPRFWLNAMVNHSTIANMISNADEEECLKAITNLDIEEFEDVKSGYRLRAYFAENPYIANNIIVKEFHILDSEEIDIKTTPVDYKDTIEAKKLQDYVAESNEQAKRTRSPEDSQPRSFFAWLVNSSKSSSDDIADILKDQIWPNPLEYFFAGPTDVDDDDDDDGASDDDDDSEDDDEDIDEEDIDDDDVIPEGYEISGEEELDDEDDVEN